MVSNQLGHGERFRSDPDGGFHSANMPQRSDGVGNALRVLCPTCKTPLPDDMLALIAKIDALTGSTSARG